MTKLEVTDSTQMEAVIERDEKRTQELIAIYENLREKTGGVNLFKSLDKVVGYGHYTFNGLISDELIKALGRRPTAEEIIILVDRGFSHFGATCFVSNDKFFGRVNTD